MLQKEEGAEHMAMTTCKECGKQVSTEAKACPHCGAAAPARKKAKGGIGKWLLVVFAIGVVVACGAAEKLGCANRGRRQAPAGMS